jgi:hypothetical protein
MLRFRLESAQLGSDSVIQHTDTAIMDIRDIAITRAAITATTGVIHITERITTLGGRTTAIDITSITSAIITTTKYRVDARLIGWLGGIPSQLFFSSMPEFIPLTPRDVRGKNPARSQRTLFAKRQK